MPIKYPYCEFKVLKIANLLISVFTHFDIASTILSFNYFRENKSPEVQNILTPVLLSIATQNELLWLHTLKDIKYIKES